MSSSGRRFAFRPQLEVVEARCVPAGFSGISDDAVVIAPDNGGIPRVKIIDPNTGEDVAEIEAYETSFRGGVRTALGDITGDGVRDLVIAPGVGGGPRIKIIDGSTGTQITDLFVYEPTFTQGLYVAVGDVNGDGRGDIITGTGNGGGPRVRVLDGATLGRTVLRDFFAYEGSFRGGVLVASGDVNGDGRDDIITGTGVGGGPRVIAFNATDDRVLRDFFAYEDSFRGGVLVGAGDINGDSRDDIVTGTGPGGGPVVTVRSGSSDDTLLQFLADDSSFRGGVSVDCDDTNGDGRDDVISRTRRGNSVNLFVNDGASGTRVRSLSRTVDDNPSASDILEGGSGGGSGGGGGGSSGGGGNQTTVVRVEGTITAVNSGAGTFSIRKQNGQVEVVRIGPGTKVERNDLHTTLSAFKVNDFGEARIGSDGIAWKVEAVGP